MVPEQFNHSQSLITTMTFSKMVEDYQRGLSEAQNGYGFSMIPKHGAQTGSFQAKCLIVALVASFPQHLSMKTARLGAHA